MDQHLKGSFRFPKTPDSELILRTDAGVPEMTVKPDSSKPVRSVDVFYTQHGKRGEEPSDRENTMSRYWHHAKAVEADGLWKAKLPLASADKPLWVYANVTYPLEKPVTGAGYYYGIYTATSFNVSSQLMRFSAEEVQKAGRASGAEAVACHRRFPGRLGKGVVHLPS